MVGIVPLTANSIADKQYLQRNAKETCMEDQFCRIDVRALGDWALKIKAFLVLCRNVVIEHCSGCK